MDHNDKNLALVRVTLNGFGHVQWPINTLMRNSGLIQVEGMRHDDAYDDAFANRGCFQRTWTLFCMRILLLMN